MVRASHARGQVLVEVVYGALISFTLAPLRWWSPAHAGLLVVFAILPLAS
ncbi:hypothetical protein [Actinotalea sp. K2]|nr:hypothetical protein [Actinotalea sp. K2]MCL3861708.1 hypothetical protein [Actinotalea sp. K2]